MYYTKLNINGTEYQIAVNITGSGAPTVEASAGMFYMDTDTGNIYKCLGDTSWELLLEVVQTTGSSKKAVMSQAATTEALAAQKTELANTIAGVDAKATSATEAVDAKVAKNAEKISRNDKRITNLEQGLPDDEYQTDDSVAYVKDVPSNALPYAEVNRIGGMSYKTRNLIPYPYAVTSGNVAGTDGNAQYSTSADGTVTITGTNTSSAVVNINLTASDNPITLKAGTYAFSQNRNGDANAYMVWVTKESGTESTVYLYSDEVHTFATDWTCGVIVQIAAGATVSHTFKPMLNSGSTALPYEAYFEGLRSAKVTEVESVGANLFGGEALADKLVSMGGVKTETNKTVNLSGYNASGKTAYSGFKANTQYTFILKVSAVAVGAINLAVKYTDGTRELLSADTANTVLTLRFVSASGKTIDTFVGVWQTDTTYYYNECGIFEGDVSVDNFKLYVKHTLPIPEAAQVENGINADCYDFIEWGEDGTRTLNKRVGKVVFDGSTDEPWSISMEGEECIMYNTSVSNAFSYSSAIMNSDIPFGGSYDANSEHFFVASYGLILVLSRAKAATVDELRAYLAANPIELVYELATPEVTDISDILTADNFIGVEGNGILTFKNENGYDVPSEVRYQVEV